MTTLAELQTMLSVDGYDLAVDSAEGRTTAVITAGEGICGDCLVPKVVLTGMLAEALQVPTDQITLEYPADH